MAFVNNRFYAAIAQLRLAISQSNNITFVPYSNFNLRILKILKSYGLIFNYIICENDTIKIFLNPGDFAGIRPMKYIFAGRKTYSQYYTSYKILEELALENPGTLIIISTIYGLTTFDQLYLKNLRIGGTVCLIISLT